MDILYDEIITDSDPLRTEQARELERYLWRLRDDPARLVAIFTPDYSSVDAYLESAAELRQALRDSLGYPPPGFADSAAPEFHLVGSDTLAEYYRFRIPVLPKVHAVGLYLVPQ